MNTRNSTPHATTPASLWPALADAFRKLAPQHIVRNPVMAVVWLGTVLAAVATLAGATSPGFGWAVTAILFATVLFGNFAEAVAESRGRGHAASLRRARQDLVALLDAGANDYVTKPFGIEELMARIRVLLRHARRDEALAPVYDDGVLRIDLARHEVQLHGQPLALTRKEFTLLSLLARQPGRLVTQPQLLRDMWGPTHQEDAHYLRVLVGKLRAKLGDDAAAPLYIATEPGVGLRFLGRDKPPAQGEQ